MNIINFMRKSVLELNLFNSFIKCLPKDPKIELPLNHFSDEAAKQSSRERRYVENGCYSWTLPEKNENPVLIHYSKKCFDLLGLSRSAAETPDFVRVFSGNMFLPNSSSWSQCYSGFQFGNYAGQLGDGRAISLAEILNPKNQILELQLKGAGETPYSRFGDGYAVLRSSIREYLASEANNSLGIPTSRALSLIKTSTQVLRERLESGAIVCRAAPSWIRFGTFEHAYYNQNYEILKKLADYTIFFHFGHLVKSNWENFSHQTKHELLTIFQGADKSVFNTKYIDFFYEICKINAILVATWQAEGFCHGVLNTDNMSILGITIDYGPYGFLEEYNTNWTPNSSDHESRYSFSNQPDIVKWNLAMLAKALSPLFEITLGSSFDVKALRDVIDNGFSMFNLIFQESYSEKMHKVLFFDLETRTIFGE